MQVLKNIWYVAAWADELGPGDLVGRTILEQPVLLFRETDGTAVAIGNRCPHRFAPLHMGRHVGNAVQCGYHGMEFDRTGRCSFNPHGGAGGRSVASVPAYPLVERHGLLWIWMGEETPDDTLIPDALAFMTDPTRRQAHGCISIAANYQLLNDNLMDLSHGMYLHQGTLSVIQMQANYHPVVTVDGEAVLSRRESPAIPPPSLWVPGLPEGTETVDFFSYLRWDAPAHVTLEVGCRPLGSDYGAEGQIAAISGHMFTPVSAKETLYFWSFSRDFKTDSEEIDRHANAITRHAFEGEDKPMIEAQQAMMGDAELMDLDPILLRTDNAAVRVRRLLAARIAREREAQPVPESNAA